MTSVNYQIWDGPPGQPGSTVVFGDTTTNRLLHSEFSNIYWVTETTHGNTGRPIMRNVVSAGVTLGPGTYWIDWQTGGSLGSGPWVPPVTITGQTTTGNAMQSLGGTWNSITDGGTNTPQGLPFQLVSLGAYLVDISNSNLRIPTCMYPLRRRMPHLFGHGSTLECRMQNAEVLVRS